MNIIKKITQGYIVAIKNNRSTLLAPFKVLLFLGVIIGISFGIVYPLWLLASNDKEFYSSFVIILILSLTAIFLIYKAARYIYFFGFKRFIMTIVLPNLFKLLKVVLCITYIGGIIYFFNINLTVSILLTVMAFFIIGYIRFVYKKG